MSSTYFTWSILEYFVPFKSWKPDWRQNCIDRAIHMWRIGNLHSFSGSAVFCINFKFSWKRLKNFLDLSELKRYVDLSGLLKGSLISLSFSDITTGSELEIECVFDQTFLFEYYHVLSVKCFMLLVLQVIFIIYNLFYPFFYFALFCFNVVGVK